MVHSRFMRAIVIAATGAAALAGCSAAGGGTSGTAAPIDDPTASLKGVTLTLWAAETSATLADQPIAAFEEATGAKVNVVVVPGGYDTALPTKLATGSIPDLFFWQPSTQALATIRGADTLQPLSDELWADTYADSVTDIGVVDDERLAAVISAPSSIGIYYNKDVFEAAGISDIPAGFDELRADAEKIEATGVPAFYEAGEDKWPLQWLPSMLLAETTQAGDFWPSINTNDGKTWADPEIVDAIASWKELTDDGLTQPDYLTGTFEAQSQAIYDGTVGMTAQLGALTSVLGASYSPEEIDAKVGFFPLSRDGNIGTFVADQGNAIVAPKTGDAAQEAAARQFIAFWLGPDYEDYITAGNQVSIISNVDSPDTVPAVVRDNIDAIAGAVGAFQMESLVIPNGFVDYLQEVLYDTKTPQEAADASWSEVKKIAEAQGLPGF